MPRITTSLRRAVISGDEEEEQREGGLARIESDEEESANYRTPIKKRKTRAHRDSLGQADENSDEEDKVRLRRKRDRNSDSGSHSNSIQTTPNKMSSDTRSLLKYQGTYYRDEYGGDLEDEQDAEDEEELESFIVSDDASIDEEEDEAEAEEEEEHEIGQGEMEEEENSDEVDSGNGNASKRKAVRILEDEEEVQESDARGVGMDQAQPTGGQEPREQPTEMARADGPQWDSNANEVITLDSSESEDDILCLS